MVLFMQTGIESLWNGLSKWLLFLSLLLLPSQLTAASTCLKDTVYAEARGESKLGQQAVAHVILNRARQTGKTPCAIVREAGQFKSTKAPKDFTVNVSNRDPTNGATHFQVRNLSRWLGLRKYITIGNHTFYGR